MLETPHQQLSLFSLSAQVVPDFAEYDRILVAFSGGKDSIACFLTLLEHNVPKEKIELHHHLVDGRTEKASENLFDWPCTEDYCRKFAKNFEVPIYFSWLDGGFKGEILRTNEPKAKTFFETPSGEVKSGGGRGEPTTRRMFPAKQNDLTKRWCSPYLKIDVLSLLIRNQSRFTNSKTLVLVGERAAESQRRAKYKEFEPHRTDTRDSRIKGSRRQVDVWRAVHKLTDSQVWEKIKTASILPHPAYRMGWGRLSCRACIFGSPNQWASNFSLAPLQTGQIHQLEQELDFTIDNNLSIAELAERGTAYPGITEELTELAMSTRYSSPIVVPERDWEMPAGAWGEMNGPG